MKLQAEGQMITTADNSGTFALCLLALHQEVDSGF